MAKKLYIIDGHIYAAYYAPMSQRLTSPAGEPTKATYIFTTAILGLISDQNPDLLAVAMDSKTPSFRTKIYPEYKAHRPPMPNDMPAQILWFGHIIAEVSCQTRYCPEASSISFQQSVRYGFGYLSTAVKYHLAKMNIIKSRLFPPR